MRYGWKGGKPPSQTPHLGLGVYIEAVPQLVRVRCKACHALRGYASPQNQLHLAECTCRKSCMVGCDVLRGVGTKSLLKVRLRCKACHALPCEDRQAPQKQLHLAECIAEKAAWWGVGC